MGYAVRNGKNIKEGRGRDCQTVNMSESAKIEVDSRETALIAQLPEAIQSGLGTGDVVIGDKIIIERKRVDDLAASIKDGRWRDQLARMNAMLVENPFIRTAVIVEGKLPDYGRVLNGIPRSTLESALAGAFVRDGACIFRTEGILDTVRLIRTLADRVGRGESPSVQGGSSATGVRNPCRKDVLSSARFVAKAQLRVIPGVSERVAEAIMAECETIGQWLVLWSGRQKELADIKVRTKRLGNVLAERILSVCGGQYLNTVLTDSDRTIQTHTDDNGRRSAIMGTHTDSNEQEDPIERDIVLSESS